MSNLFGWCFIGCGTLAKQVAKQITKSGRHKIVSVYSRSYEKCACFADKYGAKACHTAEEAITTDGVEGVYIVTPHNSHFAYAKQALELGKPVLCEKAFTITAAQAKELTALAKEKKLYLAEAMWTWFAPVANQVKQWLEQGEFGEIRRLVLDCRVNSKNYAPRVTDPNAAGGALLDMGVYAITYLYRLFGKPTEIKCTGNVFGGIDWDEEVMLTFPSGETYSTSISIRYARIFGKLLIEGTKAKIKIIPFHCANRVKLIRKGGKNEVFSGSGNYLNEFNIAASEIREGLTESRFVPHKATIDIMEIMDECRRQMKLVYPFEKP